jgi:hypothetical protein
LLFVVGFEITFQHSFLKVAREPLVLLIIPPVITLPNPFSGIELVVMAAKLPDY